MLECLGLLEGAFNEISGGVKRYFKGKQFRFMDIAFIPFASWFLAWYGELEDTIGDSVHKAS